MASKPQDTSSPNTPRDEQPLTNPTRRENWPVVPKDAKAFETWMARTQCALLAWLTEAQDRARHTPSMREISEHNQHAEDVWSGYKPRTDVQTGIMYERDEQLEMTRVMNEQMQLGQELHEKLLTYHRAIELKYAELSWEDFLYYQNVWHRKYFDPDNQFFLTKADQAFEKANAKANKAKPWNESPVPKVAAEKSSKDLPDTPWLNEEDGHDLFSGPYYEWRNHMIELFIKFKVGYRKRMPEAVGPETAHRYSQPPRGTINQSFERGKDRFTHLEAAFPRSKTKRLDAKEVEERPAKKRKGKQDEVVGKDELEPIVLRLDDEAFKQTQDEKEQTYRKDSLTKALLPANHLLHHGCLETSFDWPTSFDSPAWGNNVSVTAMKRKYVYEKVQGAEKMSDEEQKYKRDEKGEKIVKLDKRPRYQMTTVNKPGRVFVPERHAPERHDPKKAVYQESYGKQLGHWEDGDIKEEKFLINEQNQRTQLPPQYCIKNEFRILTIPVGDLPDFQELDLRPGRPEEGGKGGEWSADEEKDCVKSNANFEWSAHNAGNQADTKAPGEESESSLTDLEDSLGEEGEEESDDEGDLFVRAYKESDSGE